jgi:hypothetical protein
MANSFDLNIPLQDEDNVFDLNIPLEDEDNVFDPDAPLEENNGNTILCLILLFPSNPIFS